MACLLAGVMPLSLSCLDTVNWTLRNKFQWYSNQNSYIIIQENAFQNAIRKMSAILSQPQCVDYMDHVIKIQFWNYWFIKWDSCWAHCNICYFQIDMLRWCLLSVFPYNFISNQCTLDPMQPCQHYAYMSVYTQTEGQPLCGLHGNDSRQKYTYVEEVRFENEIFENTYYLYMIFNIWLLNHHFYHYARGNWDGSYLYIAYSDHLITYCSTLQSRQKGWHFVELTLKMYFLERKL